MLRISICEDDLNQLENLSDYINMISLDLNLNVEIVSLLKSYCEMETFIENSHADLYILDINLGEECFNKNGYELAKRIRNKSNTDYILFVTDCNEFVYKAYDVKAYHFLNKPINYDLLKNVLLRILNEFNENKNENEKNIINITDDCILHRINLDDVVIVEKTCSKKITIKLKNGNIIQSRMTISEFEKMCKNTNLIRTHKSFICNVNFITSINFKNKEILMNNGDTCLLGRVFKDNLKGMLKDSYWQKYTLS